MKRILRSIAVLMLCTIPAFATTGSSTNVQQALTTSALVKNVGGGFFGYTIYNPNGASTWVFWYNTKTAPTIGSTTNLVLEVAVPASGTVNVEFGNGIDFSTGLYVAVATTANGNTAPGSGLTITTLYR